ncbi:hypothetical protein [Thalassotalea sp. PLHSN55]|uniref:hypothetical protein n=1 Tax=Thalassotalea sp. PLHSN55 TaxID=3435888 RepID=UPI003F87E0BC
MKNITTLIMALCFFSFILSGCASVVSKHYLVGSGDVTLISKVYPPSDYYSNSPYSRNPLEQALRNGDRKTVKHLMDNHHPFPNAFSGDPVYASHGSTQAELACSYGNFDLAYEIQSDYNITLDPTKCLHKLSIHLLDSNTSQSRFNQRSFLDVTMNDAETFIVQYQRFQKHAFNGGGVVDFKESAGVHMSADLYVNGFSQPLLKSENKRQYIESGIQRLLDDGADVNAWVNQDSVIDRTSINQFHTFATNVTPAWRARILQAGYNFNNTRECSQYLKCSLMSQLAMMPIFHAQFSVSYLFNHSQEQMDEIIEDYIRYGLNVNGGHSRRVIVGVRSAENINRINFKREDHYLNYLQMAAYYNNELLFNSLIKFGADPTLKSSAGLTVFDYADLRRRMIDNAHQLAYINEQKNSEFIGKLIALGLGGAAIASLDIPVETASQALSALTTDVITDGEAGTTNRFYQKASEGNIKPNNHLESANQSRSQDRSQKPVDCIHEYNRAEMHLRNTGHFNFGNCDVRDAGSQCSSKIAIKRRGAINNELRSRGFPQCQQAVKQPTASPRQKLSDKSQIEM